MKAQVTDSADLVLGEVAGEFFERLARGERPQVEEYARKYPELAEQIRRVIPALELVGASSSGPHGSASPSEFSAPQRLGDFQLIRELGRGGMGVVYEAEQLSMGRRVALKVLPFAAMVQAQALQRFRNEVRAAAALTHDHIVSVYSIGEERGVHYYAMQLIRGQSLAEVIAQLVKIDKGDAPAGSSSISRLLLASPAKAEDMESGSAPTEPVAAVSPAAGVASPPNETEREVQARRSTAHKSHRGSEYYQSAVRLGIEAAEALQHAHDQGVIHRDIKPGNLLLDADARLYITDFGLARIESDVGLTMSGDLIGTLRYMAPEQALAKRVVVDHRADIYSLGATLYELLTLEPPFGESDRKELLKQIAFQDPRPLRKLDRHIPADLETIILKSMEKDPGERYQTAEALAADLRAFLEHRPIRARPPMLLERGLKWCRRQPGIVATAAAILILATIGLTISNVLIAQQRNAAQIAQGNEAEQRKVAEKKRDEARDQRIEAEKQTKIAEESFQRARKAVDDYFTTVSETQLLDVPSLQPLRKDLLELARNYYEEFAREHENDPKIRAELAAIQLRLGKIYGLLGSPEKAAKSLEKAHQGWKSLLDESPGSISYKNQLVQTHLESGRLQRSTSASKEALASFQQAVQIAQEALGTGKEPELMHLLAQAHHEVGKQQMKMDAPALALPSLHSAATRWEQLLADKRDVLRFQSSLAQVRQDIYHAEINHWVRTGTRTAKTPEQIAAEAAALNELRSRAAELEKEASASRSTSQQEELARLSVSLGDVIRNQSDALPYCENGVALFATLAKENPAVPDYRFRHAAALHNLSRRQASLGWAKAEEWKRDEAILSEWQAIQSLEDLTRLHPGNYQFQAVLGECYIQLAKKLLWSPIQDERTKKWSLIARAPGKSEHEEEILQLYQKGIDRYEIAVQLDPSSDLIRTHLGSAYFELAERQTLEKKERLLLRGIEVYKQLADSNPDAPNYRKTAEGIFIRYHQQVAEALAKENKLAESISEWKKAIDLCLHPVAFAKEDRQIQLAHSFCLLRIAANQILHGDRADAVESYNERIKVLKLLGEKNPYGLRDLGMTYYWRGKIQSELGRQQEAEESWKSALEQLNSIPENKQEPASWELAGTSFYSLGRYEEAQTALEKSLGEAKDQPPTLSNSWWYLAMIQHRQDKHQEAKALFDQLDALLKNETNPTPWTLRLRAEAAAVLGIKPE
jgi:eukaryotic-like serine/threonine-protein kinase